MKKFIPLVLSGLLICSATALFAATDDSNKCPAKKASKCKMTQQERVACMEKCLKAKESAVTPGSSYTSKVQRVPEKKAACPICKSATCCCPKKK